MEQWHYEPAGPERMGTGPLSHASPPAKLVHGIRSLTAVVLRSWLRIYHGLRIVGRQNLPARRSYVLIANHASHLDALCLLAALPRSRLDRAFPVAAKDYFCVSAVRSFLAGVVANVLPFDRYQAPLQSLDLCAQLLRQPGSILIFFPEGTRSSGFEPGDFKPGVGLLAAGQDIPVVPCHLAGTHAALPKGAWCPRPTEVRLTIGAPRCYAHLPASKEAVLHICRDLRAAVMNLGRVNPDSERNRVRNPAPHMA